MKKLMLDAPEFTGLNCDSQASPTLEGLGTPRKTCDMRNVSGMFPPAFNELRKKLYEEHTDMWNICGGMLIYNHDLLFEYLNNELDCICSPEFGMQLCCERWIKALDLRVKVSRQRHYLGEIK